MRKLIVFNQISVDGYIAGADGDMSWAHKGPDDAEWNAYVSGNASANGTLVFGRVTYDMMAKWWPTPQAAEAMPTVAEGMNRMQKIVFSRTMDHAAWTNTRLIQSDLTGAIRKLKTEPGEAMVILGSGSIVAQLARQNLIDEYQMIVNPVALGGGKTMFDGMDRRMTLKRSSSRMFANGNTLLCYEPA